MIKKVKCPVRIDFAGGTTDIKSFSHKYGGVVLNAAINKYVTGKLIATNKKVSLEYSAQIPTSSGLGTSGAMTLLWLALINKTKDKKELAEQVYGISVARGIGESDGKQDQYAAAFGGINLMSFKKNKVNIKNLKLKKKTIKQLEKNLILVYTGKPHFSGDANKAMIDNLKKGKNVKNLKKIKKIALDMEKYLEKNNLGKFSELLNKETEQRRQLSDITVPKSTEKIIKKGLKYADAAKVLGSGGGGSILFYGNKNKIKKQFKHPIEFKFDWKGLKYL